jgi:integrase
VKQAKKSTATKATEKVGPFTLDEVRKLMAKASDEWQGMILFGFHTGLRMMDIAELGAVNLDGATLIRRSDKTETQTRTPLHPQLAEWVKGRGEWLFPKIRTMKKNNVSTTFSNLREKASVPKEITLPGGEKAKRSFHSLRHTFTSILANADIPEEVRMNLTGQKTSAVHANYTHFDAATLAAAIDKLPTI